MQLWLCVIGKLICLALSKGIGQGRMARLTESVHLVLTTGCVVTLYIDKGGKVNLLHIHLKPTPHTPPPHIPVPGLYYEGETLGGEKWISDY